LKMSLLVDREHTEGMCPPLQGPNRNREVIYIYIYIYI
jgi:hypothetical protein